MAVVRVIKVSIPESDYGFREEIHLAPARAPTDWIEAEFDQTVLNGSENVEPVPEFQFDQTVSW